MMSEKVQPGFYSILPATVRYDENLSSSEKLFFTEITALSNKNGYCHASNRYFSDLYDVTKNTVSRWLKHLKEYNYVQVELIREGKEIKGRKIFPILDVNRGINKNDDRGINKNDDTSPQKSKEGIPKNVKEEYTRSNTTSNNIKPTDSSDKKDSEEKPSNKKQTDYKGVYEHYMSKGNLINHRKYTKRITIALKGAMDEAGLTEEDMKKIIDKHSQLVELSQLDKYTVPPRPLHELFGQHVTNMKTSPLLCEEYMNGSTKDRFLQTLIKKHVKTSDDKGEVNSGLVVNEKKIRTTKRADDDINGRG